MARSTSSTDGGAPLSPTDTDWPGLSTPKCGREVAVNSNEMAPGPFPRMMAAKAAASFSDAAPVPVEAGKAQVVVNVSGSVQMR